jgi:hypothetical protein
MFKRLLYFFYYLKENDWKKLSHFLSYAVLETKRSRFTLFLEAVGDAFRYNISLLDYFYFKFYQKQHEEKIYYAGTGFMYEYQLKMNPISSRSVLHDKIEFLNAYKEFVHRIFASKDTLINNPKTFTALNNRSGKLVVKGSKGQVGAEVKVLDSNKFDDVESLISYMNDHDFDLVEEFVIQHPDLMKLSSSGLNTIRVITQLINNEVIILGARLRITINSTVDNMAAGNPAAPIDVRTGIVSGNAVFSDISKPEISLHPITGVTIAGFKIPYWNEIIAMIERAAIQISDNRSVGWDVAVTEEGPQLIEGNHNWCKLLWQLPVNKGLKKELEQFLK